MGDLIYRRQLRKGWAHREKPIGRRQHTGVTWKGKGAESWKDTAGQRQLHREEARDRLCLPCPSLFLVIKFEIGALEAGSMEHGGEGREAAQWKHKVQWVWMRKGRHSAVHTATALQ